MTESQPIRLVHVLNCSHALPGFLGSQIDYMKSQGIEMTIVSQPTENLNNFGDEYGVNTVGIPISRKISISQDLLSIYRLWKLFRQLKPTIVHSHSPKSSLVTMTAAFLAMIPVRIYHLRGLPLLTAGRSRFLFQLIERYTCALAHQVICVSPSIRAEAIKAGCCTEEKSVALGKGSGNGIDSRQKYNPSRWSAAARAETKRKYNIPQDAFVIGHIGRLIREKGILELAEAWRILRQKFDHLHLVIAGPFEDRDPVPEEIKIQLQQDPRVHLLGPVWETPPLYAIFDLFAFPSHREGFGMVALEANTMGIPVVGSDIPGCHDSIEDGVTGTLVPAKSGVELANALRSYIEDPALCEQHGKAGRKRAMTDFSPDFFQEATAEIYRQQLLRAGCGTLAPQTIPAADSRKAA